MIESNAQDKLPYDKIPDAPESYTAGSVVSRMIDGLGFRYYWATDGLRTEDLQYRPCLLYTSPSPRDKRQSRMPSSA